MSTNIFLKIINVKGLKTLSNPVLILLGKATILFSRKSPSALVAFLEKVIKTKLSEEELEILKNLFEVGNELRSLKSKEPSKKNEEIDKIIEDLKNIINMFYDR